MCSQSLNPTLWYPVDSSPPGSSLHRSLQARMLEWVANPFSRESSQSGEWNCVSSIGRRILYHWAIWEAKGSPTLTVIDELKFYWQSQILFFGGGGATGDWGILVPWDQGSNSGPWQWKSRVLTTRPPSNSLKEPNSYEGFGRGVVLKIMLRVGFLKLVLAIARLIWSAFV